MSLRQQSTIQHQERGKLRPGQIMEMSDIYANVEDLVKFSDPGKTTGTKPSGKSVICADQCNLGIIPVEEKL